MDRGRAPLAAPVPHEGEGAERSRFRPLVESDLASCREIFDEAQRDLYARNGRAWLPADPSIMDRLLRHLLATDPDRAWVAHSGRGRSERALGFAMALRRERLWFLAFLFVRPDAQGAGIGRQLLERAMPLDGERGLVLATCIDALQPVSGGLYASYGMVPRVPLMTMLGQVRAGSLPGLPGSAEPVGFDELAAAKAGHARLVETLDGLDRSVLGVSRPADHRFWRDDRRQGVLFVDRGSGRPLGYGYATVGGRIGPLAVVEPDILPGALGHLVAAAGVATLQMFVPGTAERALVPLLRSGLRLEGTPALWCATEALVDLERYLPAGFALP